MLWHAMPPEANAAMLIAGAGPALMLEAAAAWSTSLLGTFPSS
jgi:PPE-repeat protein